MIDTAPVIETRRLVRRYGRHVAIDRVDLAVRRGELVGFLGPNGAGKSTLIRVLLGFLRPSAGGATVLGRDCWRRSVAVRRDTGYLPGDVRLYPWLTVERGVAFVSRVRERDVRDEGARIAARFELPARKPARAMSRGMRQKLGLVLALAADPAVLVLDEPTSGLDPLMQHRLLEMLRERAARGTTVLFSSHALGEVERLCDRIAIVRAGRIVADETIAALRARARRQVTIEFADADAAAAAPPECLAVDRREGRRWHGTLAGPAAPLLQWAAGRPVVDCSLGEPDLERLFHAYYGDGETS